MKSFLYQFYLILIIISIFQISIQLTEADLVKTLPDYSYKGRLYSGYLQVDKVKQYHYMFNLAYQDPDHKPLVLWLNGGPGCSSLDGWANEHGPMTLDSDGNFQLNEYSWNRAANMIYLESPGGVGFSYIDSDLDYELAINDDIAAQDNLQALLSFFKKFPSMKNKEFYISGESYGGIYVPMLAYNIIQYNKGVSEAQKINLKGILVGNGVTDWNYDAYPATIDFAFTHHLYSYEQRMEYNKDCIMEYQEDLCANITLEIYSLLDGVNIYDYLRECAIPKTSNGEIDTNSKYYKYARWAFRNINSNNDNNDNKMEKLNILNIEEEKKLEGATPCFDDTNIERYFNREDVQAALHVQAKNKWMVCSDDVGKRYVMQDKGSIWTYPTLIKEGIRIMVYNGDTDAVVPFNGNQAWVRQLRLEIEKPWTQWRAFGDTDNVAGYVTKYKGLTFCTIKGTGHMVPQWKPKESYFMFSKFINGEDLTE